MLCELKYSVFSCHELQGSHSLQSSRNPHGVLALLNAAKNSLEAKELLKYCHMNFSTAGTLHRRKTKVFAAIIPRANFCPSVNRWNSLSLLNKVEYPRLEKISFTFLLFLSYSMTAAAAKALDPI